MIRDILKLLSKDNLQVQALTECYEMIELCEKMVTASVDSLRNRDDAQMEENVYDMDKKLNRFERDVRRKVMTHLSLGHIGDLTSGLTLVSIVIDLERIGDYSKNIHDLARNHPKRLHGGEVEAELKEIEEAALENFSRGARAFRAGDVDEARALMAGYKEDISSKCAELEERLVAGGITLPSHEAVTVALYLRCLKRVSAHTRNLLSSLVNPFVRIGYAEKKKKQ